MSINTYKRQTGYNFDGEPLIIMTADGTTFEFRAGQPVMDAGEENWINIGMWTRPGWWGNHILEKANQIGDCNLDELIRESITRTMLLNSEKEAVRGCSSLVDNKVSSGVEAVIETVGMGLALQVKVHKPVGTIETIIFQKYGGNWIRQATDPASARMTNHANQ